MDRTAEPIAADVAGKEGLQRSAAEELDAVVRDHLEHALDAARRRLKVYESLRNLDEVIGAQYGDRVLYELIQNAHDAHADGEAGRIAIELEVTSPAHGVLYIANGGRGFAREDVDAIRNLAISSKEVGEGIGNKGLGFRSIEALTDDAQIYSRRQDSAVRSDRFDGYCFRFASAAEIEVLLEGLPGTAALRRRVADTLPTYLMAVPIASQSEEVARFARAGFATVIVLPLQTEASVSLATEQVQAVAHSRVPLLLFLRRIAEVEISYRLPDKAPERVRLTRREAFLNQVDGLPRCSLHRVDVANRRFLIVRREVEKERVLDAVRQSIPAVPQLRRWLKWRGVPEVAVAVDWSRQGVEPSRLYNFLPMGEASRAPLAGYLDAPFFTDIDRRTAKTDLPLNELFLTAAAEACAAAALHIASRALDVPPHTAFDLIGWEPAFMEKVKHGFTSLNTSLEKAQIVPVISPGRGRKWASLSEARIWPSEPYRLLKARELARRAAATLVLPELGEARIERLRALARSVFEWLRPTVSQLVLWSQAFASDLLARKSDPGDWSQFYEELAQVFRHVHADLSDLGESRIFLTRGARLTAARTTGSDRDKRVYVRPRARSRKRSVGASLLLPESLSRRFIFFDDRVALTEQAAKAYADAGLLIAYDPLEALAGLSAALGSKASDERREEALVWAFQVWRELGAETHESLREAALFVPTRGGWRAASASAFSASWSATGVVLERYLAEAAEVSADCRKAEHSLLLAPSEWPTHTEHSKRDWRSFLTTIGVIDGFICVAGTLKREGAPAYTWDPMRYNGSPECGLDDDWCEEVSGMYFGHPYTSYRMQGEAWRVPGQLEHAQLSQSAKEGLSELVFEHLRTYRDHFFYFSVGRYDRASRDRDIRRFPTPFAAFVRKKAWITAQTREGIAQRIPSQCWGARGRGGGPPRFMDRVPEQVHAHFLYEGGEIADFLFGPSVGLRDWRSNSTAVARLRDLAALALDLAASERVQLRREYQRAWLEVTQHTLDLPKNLAVLVSRRGQFEVLSADEQRRPQVMVTGNIARLETALLMSAGIAVLDVGEAEPQRVVALLLATGSFDARRLDSDQVQLFVDGEMFVPRPSDPTLISMGAQWLPDVVTIGHDLMGEQLEKGVLHSTVEARCRAIRVRRCEHISLVVKGQEAGDRNEPSVFSYEHETCPTLILINHVRLDWHFLVGAADRIARLIDPRLRSLETLLLRLWNDRPRSELDPPSDEELARATRTDVQRIREQLLALRSDTGRVLSLVLPVVAVLGGLDLALSLRVDFEHSGSKLSLEPWLQAHLSVATPSAREIVEACVEAGDRATLRRRLGLEFESFNQALVGLGERPESNEGELRRIFDVYVRRMKSELIDRLRSCYRAAYLQRQPLDRYLEIKTLAFLTFNTKWILTHETLEAETATVHVNDVMRDTLRGLVAESGLEPLASVLDANRKTVQMAARQLRSLVSAWCRKHDLAPPGPWTNAAPQGVVEALEANGLLDFERLAIEQVPTQCVRGGIWPPGMPEKSDPEELGLAERDLREEERLGEVQREEAERERRIVRFNGEPLDSGSSDYIERFLAIATQFADSDSAWFDRSRRRLRLAELPDVVPSSGGVAGQGFGGRGRRPRQMSEAERQLAGLAGEWLAYQFLRRRYPDCVDEACWVSENRGHFFPGMGDDSAGYDFRVQTPHTEFLYEVKASLEDSGEFELTANEIRVASSVSRGRRIQYRILYVPRVLSPRDWYVRELPNPMSDRWRSRFQTIGTGGVRLRFVREEITRKP